MSTDFILGLVFLFFAIVVSLAKKTYFELPLSELKKRSAFGEPVSSEISRSLAYDGALRCLLWILLGLSSAASLTLLARALPIWISIIVFGYIIYFLFSYLPNTKVGSLDTRLTKLLAPGFNWILNYTSKYLNRIYSPLAKRYFRSSNQIFDSQDLFNFLKQQSRRTDTRIEPEAFGVLERSLNFGNLRVGDLMTPAKKVKTLLESDVIGPILINELHESREGYALVRAEAKGDITGLLLLSDLNIRSQGSVASHMRKDVCFVSTNDFAAIIIKSFYDTKSQIYVVINENRKFVGTISLDTVIKQITGPLDGLASQIEEPASPDDVAKVED